MDLRSSRPLLVAGVPRSATTWVATMLASVGGVRYVHEPDNIEVDPLLAGYGKVGLGYHPVLRPGVAAPRYRRLWELALLGGWTDARAPAALRSLSWRLPRPMRVAAVGAAARLDCHTPRPPAARIVAKSVNACFALEWLAEEFDMQVVVVQRAPMSVLASWLSLGFTPWGVSGSEPVRDLVLRRLGLPEREPEEPLERVAWGVGVLRAAVDDALTRHPEWVVVEHEELCADPEPAFRRLFAHLDWPWKPAVGEQLRAGDRPGEGFSLQRRTRDQAESWRRRLPAADVAAASRVFAAMGIEVAASAPPETSPAAR